MKKSRIDTSGDDITTNALVWTLMSVFVLLAAVNAVIAASGT